MSKVALVTGASSGIGAATARELGDAVAVQADVADDVQCRRLVRAVLDEFGGLDALVNNAGTTKVVAPFQMVRACSDALKKARGAIVNVSSVASVLGTGSSVAYAASKAALETMSFSLARSLAPDVRVNVVAPGHTNTPWHPTVRGPERAAEVEIVWLIEGARNVTGETIYVDGGMHIAAPR